MIWLQLTRSNNAPDNIACFYLQAVNSLEGCSVELITDLGTENSLVAAIHAYFRGDPDAHRYVSSPRNQRIESWWSQFSKHRSCWWRNFFKDLEASRKIDTSSLVSMEALWYSFSNVLQKELDLVREHWNTHRIRKSHYQTVCGRPDSLNFLPEAHGSLDYKQNVKPEVVDDVSENVIVKDYSNEHTEYFDYVLTQLDIQKPDDWREALSLYERLMSVC